MAKSKPSKPRKAKTEIPVPKNLDEVERFTQEVARCERQIDVIANSLSNEVARLTQEAYEQAAILAAKSDSLFAGIYAYSTAHRDELTADGKKSVDLASGTISWRISPKAVQFPKGKTQAIIEQIKTLGLQKEFLRVKESIDKEAMLKDPNKALSIAGIKITQEELFSLKLKDLDSEILGKKGKRLKKSNKKKKDDE